MVRTVLFGTLALLAGSTFALGASPKDDVTAAAKKLADAKNYTWTSTSESAGGNNSRTNEGKTEKGGLTLLNFNFGNNKTEILLKGDKGVVKSGDDDWKTLDEASQDNGGQPGPGRFLAAMAKNFKTPAAQAEAAADKVKDLKKTGDSYTADLTEDGIKDLSAFRGRGGNAPGLTNAKGSITLTVKDGVLSKMQYHITGTMSRNGQDQEIDRTTTVEIKDVGSTKIDIPEEAKKKLGSAA